MKKQDTKRQAFRASWSGFTLIEMLVVLVLLLVLASIGLPTVKKLLSDEKISKTSRNIAAFFDGARSRAIAENRYVGVRIERRGTDNFGLTHSGLLRELTGVPPYSGDSADAVATVNAPTAGTTIATAVFSNNDSPLLWLSSSMIANAQANPPIRIGDLLELPGGRTFAITGLSNSGTNTTVSFDLTDGSLFPASRSLMQAGASRAVKYRIHRSPVPSATKTLAMPRGIVVDLNYSGIGVGGSQFHPPTAGGGSSTPIDIVFGPDGAVAFVNNGGSSLPPVGRLFLCLGQTDGLPVYNGATAPFYGDLFLTDSRGTVNVRNLESLWVVINPSTGRVTTSPFASVPAIPGDVTTPDTGDFATALGQARSLAVANATLDSSP